MYKDTACNLTDDHNDSYSIMYQHSLVYSLVHTVECGLGCNHEYGWSSGYVTWHIAQYIMIVCSLKRKFIVATMAQNLKHPWVITLKAKNAMYVDPSFFFFAICFSTN